MATAFQPGGCLAPKGRIGASHEPQRHAPRAITRSTSGAVCAVRLSLDRGAPTRLGATCPAAPAWFGVGCRASALGDGPSPRRHRAARCHASAAPTSGSASPKALRVLISTGDVSGDLHAARLVTELLSRASAAGVDLEVLALGGSRVEAAGARLVGDNTGLSSIGLWEALPLVLPSLRLQRVVRDELKGSPPDVAVLIDYPGVNIPFGKYLKEEGSKVVYYIPPNEWLWSDARTPDIVDTCDAVLAVYPEEARHFRDKGGAVSLVGHPLVDTCSGKAGREEARRELGVGESETLVALIPASRKQETRLVWPYIAAAAKILRDTAPGGDRLRFVLPTPPESDLRGALEAGAEAAGLAGLEIFVGDPHVVMAAADVALTKSGTANVELALFKCPQVVVYRLDAPTAFLAQKVLRIDLPYISLVNVVMGEEVVPELVQQDATAEAIAERAVALLPGAAGGEREAMLGGYERLYDLLGGGGAAGRAASHVLSAAGVGEAESLSF